MRSASSRFSPTKQSSAKLPTTFFFFVFGGGSFISGYIYLSCVHNGRNSLLYSGCALSINPVPTRLCRVIYYHGDKKYPFLASGNRVKYHQLPIANGTRFFVQ